MNLVCYPKPMPGQEIKNYFTVSWDVPKFDDLSAQLTSNGLGGVPGAGEVLNWDWGDKIGNTILYGIYLHALQKDGKAGNKFYGNHPIHFIDSTLRR